MKPCPCKHSSATNVYFIALLDWLQENTLQRVVLVINSLDKDEDVERWQFDIQCENAGKTSDEKGDKRFATAIINQSGK